jgi:hypothetical protein
MSSSPTRPSETDFGAIGESRAGGRMETGQALLC